MRVTLVTLSLFALAGCAASGGPPFVSGQYPPVAASANSEPEPISSLPPGGANIPASPFAGEPNFASLTLRAF